MFVCALVSLCVACVIVWLCDCVCCCGCVSLLVCKFGVFVSV